VVFRIERVWPLLVYLTTSAVAFALGVVFLDHPTFGLDVKGIIFGTTVMVVVMTILILGGLTPYMLKWLKITDGDAPKVEGDAHSKTEQGLQGAEQYKMVEDDTGEKTDQVLGSSVIRWIFMLDNKYLRPFFMTQKAPHIDKVDWTRTRSMANIHSTVAGSPMIQRTSVAAFDVVETYESGATALRRSRSEYREMEEIDLAKV
jgi:hypothetical protein